MSVECPICHKPWPNDCQQATIITRHGSCAMCRYSENPPEGMTQDQCESELREMFGPGDYFVRPMKEGFPTGSIKTGFYRAYVEILQGDRNVSDFMAAAGLGLAGVGS